MEKKKTSIRIAQESRKKNNKTGYFIGYITVMNGMSAFALAVAWCWGMSAIFHMEMDTKMTNINNVTDIVVPEEAKNAQPVPAN